MYGVLYVAAAAIKSPADGELTNCLGARADPPDPDGDDELKPGPSSELFKVLIIMVSARADGGLGADGWSAAYTVESANGIVVVVDEGGWTGELVEGD